MREPPQTFEEREIRAILKLMQFMNFEFNIENTQISLASDEEIIREIKNDLSRGLFFFKSNLNIIDQKLLIAANLYFPTNKDLGVFFFGNPDTCCSCPKESTFCSSFSISIGFSYFSL